jgi:hypothetical protein
MQPFVNITHDSRALTGIRCGCTTISGKGRTGKNRRGTWSAIRSRFHSIPDRPRQSASLRPGDPAHSGARRHRHGETNQVSEHDSEQVVGSTDLSWRHRPVAQRLRHTSRRPVSGQLHARSFLARRAWRVPDAAAISIGCGWRTGRRGSVCHAPASVAVTTTTPMAWTRRTTANAATRS